MGEKGGGTSYANLELLEVELWKYEKAPESWTKEVEGDNLLAISEHLEVEFWNSEEVPGSWRSRNSVNFSDLPHSASECSEAASSGLAGTLLVCPHTLCTTVE